MGFRKTVFLFIIFIVSISCLWAEDDLLLASVPICYGEESFIAAINERTGGEREPVGLVLTGGSARALAHIGVLRYLEEHDVVPDFIISNSMGSIIAMTYAAGLSPDQILKLCTSVELGSLFNISLPFGRGLLATEGFESLVASILGEGLNIENLQIPVMIVSEDLVTKRQVRICSGDFYSIFTASYALPVFFTPVSFNGHLLTDGGIASIAPLDAAYEYGSCNIVSSTFYSGKNTNLNNPVTVLNTAIDIGKRRSGMQEIMAHPDALWIRCDVEDFSFMEFSAGELMAAKGYESAAMHEEEIMKIAGSADGHAILESLVPVRNVYERALDRALERWSPNRHITLHRTAAYPSLMLEGKTTSLLAAGWKAGAGDFEAFAGLGFDFAVNSRNTFIRPQALVSAGVYLSPRTYLQVRGYYLPWTNWKVSEKFEFTAVSEHRLRLVAGESYSFEWSGKQSLLRIYANAAWQFSETGKLEGEGAFELVSKSPGVNVKAQASMNIGSLPIGFSAGAGFRYIFTQDADHFLNIAAEGRIFWRNPSLRPTFAETFLISDLRAGVFCEYSYTRGVAGTDMIAGAFLSADTDLLGLVSIPLDIKIGWDFLYSGFYFAFRLGVD